MLEVQNVVQTNRRLLKPPQQQTNAAEKNMIFSFSPLHKFMSPLLQNQVPHFSSRGKPKGNGKLLSWGNVAEDIMQMGSDLQLLSSSSVLGGAGSRIGE